MLYKVYKDEGVEKKGKRPLFSTNQILILPFVLLVAFNAVAGEKNSGKEFYSWYDGWGTHTIWGLGKLASSYSNATIACGDEKIRVTPIYDTHENHGRPKSEQTSSDAENHNIKLVKELKNEGIICTLKK